jgi:hypothetical protein
MIYKIGAIRSGQSGILIISTFLFFLGIFLLVNINVCPCLASTSARLDKTSLAK